MFKKSAPVIGFGIIKSRMRLSEIWVMISEIIIVMGSCRRYVGYT